MIRFLHARGPWLLQGSLGVLFIWFGLLKVVGASPVADLVATVAPAVPPRLLVPAVGAAEVVIGALLLTGLWVRVTVGLFLVQMAGTFLVLVLHPAIAFQDGNPLLLSVEGEFIAKNVVLVAAGLALAGQRLGRELEDREGPGAGDPSDA